MSKAIKEIVRFQTDRDLDKKEYVSINELGSIFEEMLEVVGMDVPKAHRPQLKEKLQDYIWDIECAGIAKVVETPFGENEMVDAYCDIVVFAIGAIMKLGFDPEKALIEAGKEINSREGSMVDGKFEKDLSPEAEAKWYKADYSLAKIKV